MEGDGSYGTVGAFQMIIESSRTALIRGCVKPTTSVDLAYTIVVTKDGTTSASASRRNSRTRDHPARPEMVRRHHPVTARAPTLTWSLRRSLHSALKEFFNPLRTNDSRADFFTVYRKESSDFDRDYAGRYDGDLNTTLIFVSRPIFVIVAKDQTRCTQAGLFSAASATFVASVQPKLEQDSNDVTAVYMKILIHT